MDLARATPFEVSAGHCCRSPGFEAQATVAVLGAGGGSSAGATFGAAARVEARSATNAPSDALRTLILFTIFKIPP